MQAVLPEGSTALEKMGVNCSRGPGAAAGSRTLLAGMALGAAPAATMYRAAAAATTYRAAPAATTHRAAAAATTYRAAPAATAYRAAPAVTTYRAELKVTASREAPAATLSSTDQVGAMQCRQGWLHVRSSRECTAQRAQEREGI